MITSLHGRLVGRVAGQVGGRRAGSSEECTGMGLGLGLQSNHSEGLGLLAGSGLWCSLTVVLQDRKSEQNNCWPELGSVM